MPFDKGKKRKLIDTCGHERCYSCMFRNEVCPLCTRSSQAKAKHLTERYTPSPQRQQIHDQDWHSPNRLPKPPKPTTLAQSCPTPPHTRRRFFLSPKSLRSPFGQRCGRHSTENHVPLSGKFCGVARRPCHICISVGSRVVAADLHLNCVNVDPQCTHARRSQATEATYFIDAFYGRSRFSFIQCPATFGRFRLSD